MKLLQGRLLAAPCTALSLLAIAPIDFVITAQQMASRLGLNRAIAVVVRENALYLGDGGVV